MTYNALDLHRAVAVISYAAGKAPAGRYATLMHGVARIADRLVAQAVSDGPAATGLRAQIIGRSEGLMDPMPLVYALAEVALTNITGATHEDYAGVVNVVSTCRRLFSDCADQSIAEIAAETNLVANHARPLAPGA